METRGVRGRSRGGEGRGGEGRGGEETYSSSGLGGDRAHTSGAPLVANFSLSLRRLLCMYVHV